MEKQKVAYPYEIEEEDDYAFSGVVTVGRYETDDDDYAFSGVATLDDDDDADLVGATETSFSKLSMKRTPIYIQEEEEEEEEEERFESVQKLIKDGRFDKLKVDQCKVYLKKHGLRLTGNKDVLISRIQEHLELKDGGGEKKYPVSSFTLNCQGDACMGDVVMFEQNVFESDMFDIASRSASGPPLGKRTVVGRIVHESYGEAKQQHTFTIEVLWTKGVKPLPLFSTLLIKGRNLYRLKTMRQKWNDEEKRKKILQEKHDRGKDARLSRASRIQEKEMKNSQRENRPISLGKQATKPIPNFQQLTIHEQPRESFPPVKPSSRFLQPNISRAVEQPCTVPRKLCWYNMQGRCHFGHACRFRHE